MVYFAVLITGKPLKFLVCSILTQSNLWANRGNLSQATLKRLLQVENYFGVNNAVACGLWSGSSTPMNFDRIESLEVLTLAFPGFSGPNSHIRIPLVAFGKKFLAKHITISQVLDVVAWSFQMSLNGNYPQFGYAGEPLVEAWRTKRAGQKIGGIAVLCEFKGGWAMFKDTFCFPGFGERGGICWKCNATPDTLRQFGKEAAWRQAPLTHWDVMGRILDKGNSIN